MSILEQYIGKLKDLDNKVILSIEEVILRDKYSKAIRNLVTRK